MDIGFAQNIVKEFAECFAKYASQKALQSLSSSLMDNPNTKSAKQNVICFKRFSEKSFCKGFQGIPVDKFESLNKKLWEEFKFRVCEFPQEEWANGMTEFEQKSEHNFENGRWHVNILRCIAKKQDDKIDMAYAAYFLCFGLDEVSIDEWYFEWRFYVVPVSWNYKKKVPTLSHNQMDEILQWCEERIRKQIAHESSEK